MQRESAEANAKTNGWKNVDRFWYGFNFGNENVVADFMMLDELFALRFFRLTHAFSMQFVTSERSSLPLLDQCDCFEAQMKRKQFPYLRNTHNLTHTDKID